MDSDYLILAAYPFGNHLHTVSPWHHVATCPWSWTELNEAGRTARERILSAYCETQPKFSFDSFQHSWLTLNPRPAAMASRDDSKSDGRPPRGVQSKMKLGQVTVEWAGFDIVIGIHKPFCTVGLRDRRARRAAGERGPQAKQTIFAKPGYQVAKAANSVNTLSLNLDRKPDILNQAQGSVSEQAKAGSPPGSSPKVPPKESSPKTPAKESSPKTPPKGSSPAAPAKAGSTPAASVSKPPPAKMSPAPAVSVTKAAPVSTQPPAPKGIPKSYGPQSAVSNSNQPQVRPMAGSIPHTPVRPAQRPQASPTVTWRDGVLVA